MDETRGDSGQVDAANAEPRPLQMMGGYAVPIVKGVGPLPANRVDGARLEQFYRGLIAEWAGRTARRDASTKQLDEAAQGSAPSSYQSVVTWRYGQKISIKSREAVIALIHRAIAPDAPFACDERCRHVGAGASPEAIQVILGSLAAMAAELRRRWKNTRFDHPCYEDLQDEFEIYDAARSAVAALAGISKEELRGGER
jgi:hypothetical protein